MKNVYLCIKVKINVMFICISLIACFLFYIHDYYKYKNKIKKGSASDSIIFYRVDAAWKFENH